MYPFDDEETSTFGRFGIKLIPHDDSKRRWYVRAENETDYQLWMEVYIVLSICNYDNDVYESVLYDLILFFVFIFEYIIM